MASPTTLRVQGRDLSADQLQALQGWVRDQGQWSRNRLRRELCLRWEWRNAAGQLKTFAAAALLTKLEKLGWLELPPVRAWQRRSRPWSRQARALAHPVSAEAPITGSLAELQPVELQVLPEPSPQVRQAEGYLAHFHYRGFNRPVGAHLYYRAVDGRGRPLAVMLLGAAAWRCAARDRWIGWSDAQREARLGLLGNHARFLLLPWVRVPQLASHLLGQLAGRLATDWRRCHGVELVGIESFVERARFTGTCYAAANWRRLGHTQGRSRQDRQHRLRVGVKDVYFYPLRPDWHAVLAGHAPFDACLPTQPPPKPVCSMDFARPEYGPTAGDTQAAEADVHPPRQLVVPGFSAPQP